MAIRLTAKCSMIRPLKFIVAQPGRIALGVDESYMLERLLTVQPF